MKILYSILRWFGYELKKIPAPTPKKRWATKPTVFITQKDIPIGLEMEAVAKARSTDRVYGQINHLGDDNYLYESRKGYYDKIEQRYQESLKE